MSREDYADEARHEGKQAYRDGVTENPHPMGSMEAWAWDQGWINESCLKGEIARIRAMFPPVKRVKQTLGAK